MKFDASRSRVALAPAAAGRFRWQHQNRRRSLKSDRRKRAFRHSSSDGGVLANRELVRFGVASAGRQTSLR